MPSDLVVEVCKVESVEDHPNADRLAVAVVKGWQTIIRKSEDGSTQFVEGDLAVFVPPGAVIPRELAASLGIESLLSERTDMESSRVLVVKQVRLRGTASFGLLLRPASDAWEPGFDSSKHYGITKFHPPVRVTAGDGEREHPLFSRYTNISNLRHYPNAFETGEEVVITEKIHGTNSRVGIVDGVHVAGSNKVQRKHSGKSGGNTYWQPAGIVAVSEMLNEFSERYKVVILFGEIYGSQIQKLNYGKVGKLGYAAFDLFVDDRFLDFDEFHRMCNLFGVECAPVMYRGPFIIENVKELSEGATTLGGSHMREGVVVRPVKERRFRNGRLIMKYVSDSYMLDGKLSKADTTDV